MVKKEGKETLDAKGPDVEAKTPEPAEARTPTAEEQLAALQQQLTEVTVDRDAKDKGLRTAHQTLTEKSKELSKQTDIQSQIDELTATQRMVIGAMQERGLAPDDETLETKKTDYLKGFDDYVKQKKQDRDATQKQAQQDEHSRQCDTIYAEAKEAFKDDEDALFQVRTFLMNGATDLAEQKIAKAKKSADTKEKVMESEEERIERITEEKLRKKMEEKGMLESETGAPAGAGAGGYTPARLKEMQSTVEGRKELVKNIDKIVDEARASLKNK